jgi:condensin complex subunit 3
MRTALTGRVYDKEPSVRVQAVTALSKLAGSEDPADLTDGEPLAIDILIDILSQDPAA